VCAGTLRQRLEPIPCADRGCGATVALEILVSYSFNIFLTYDASDHAIAAFLDEFLTDLFPNVDISCSGTDIETPGMPNRIRTMLMGASAVIALISPKSMENARIHFEAGGGFLEGKGLVLCLESGIEAEMPQVLTRMALVTLDDRGLRQLVHHVAQLAGIPAPLEISGLEESLENIEDFLEDRHNHPDCAEDRKNIARQHLADSGIGSKDPLDITTHSLYRRLNRQLKLVSVKSLLQAPRRLKLPNKDALNALSMRELIELADQHNVLIPEAEYLLMQTFEQNFPPNNAPKWRKMNAFKLMEAIDSGLRRFERRF